MWFRLPIDGLQLEFQVTHYSKSKKESWDNQWCDVGFCIDNHQGLRYAFYREDITYLRDYLRLVTGMIKPDKEQTWHILDPVNYPPHK
jgi:hypothetical protein